MWFPVRLGLGPAPGVAAVNDVVSCKVRVRVRTAPGDAAVNDEVSC